MIKTLELNDGQIICKFDTETGEIIDLCDWHGNEVSYRWAKSADEAVSNEIADMVMSRGEE